MGVLLANASICCAQCNARACLSCPRHGPVEQLLPGLRHAGGGPMPDTRTTLDYIDEQLRAHAAAWREAQLEGRTDQADFYEQRVNRMLETRYDLRTEATA